MCLVEVEERPASCPPAPSASARAWPSPRTARRAPCAARSRRCCADRAPNANPGGRPRATDLAQEFGATAPFVLPDAERTPHDDRNTLMGYDLGACILCNRCVRYSTQEVMTPCSVLTFEARRGEARIVLTHGDRGSTRSASSAAAACPPDGRDYEKFTTGARFGHERALEKTKTTCTFRGVGCQIDLNVDPQTKRIVKVTRAESTSPSTKATSV